MDTFGTAKVASVVRCVFLRSDREIATEVRAQKLIEAGVDVLVIDSSQGWSLRAFATSLAFEWAAG